VNLVIKSKHFIFWILLIIMVFSLPIGIFGCQTPTTPLQQPTTPPHSTSTPTPPPTPSPNPTPAPTPSPSEEPLAKITEITGEVLVKKADADTWIKAEVNASLKPSDSIKTSDESTASILFFEGSTIELNSNTEIRISKLSINDKTKSTTIELWQEIGKTKSRVEKLVDSDSLYQIDTPHTAAVVRGSIGEVNVTGSTIIKNIEGNWYALVNGQRILIPPGFQIIVLADGTYYFTQAGAGTSWGGGGGGQGGRGGQDGGGGGQDGGGDIG
jgi:uncharacterized membrane protein YgcG